MSTIAVNAITDASGGTTASINGHTPTASNMAGKNRIINGAMMIDQRNAGASVTPTVGVYTLDRWKLNPSQASKITVQQTPSATETGYATRVGAGFSNYLACTTASAATVGAADYFQLSQSIEGLNVSDLAWGTVNAKPITLSFWVYSSLTGTFGGSLSNSGQSVGYAFNYSIPTANTWTKITITIQGPTTGTWLTTNGTGVFLIFNLGCGSNYFGTVNTWLTQTYINSPSGCVNVVATAGATFYITGVQLEVGSSATEFEHRLYGQELALCQRYCNVYRNDSTANQRHGLGQGSSTSKVDCPFQFPVQMRTAPSVSVDTIGNLRLSDGAAASTPSGYNIIGACNGTKVGNVAFTGSGLTTYRPYYVEGNGAALNTASITFSAEL